LYSNFSDAVFRAQGIVAVSVLLQVRVDFEVTKFLQIDYALKLQLGDLSNPELRMLTDQLEKIRFGGDETPVKRVSVRSLLPDTEHYMTYEGSTTSPACHETVSIKKVFSRH
jgi:Eukaryotic-type carbonic anhydrase